MSVYKRGDTWWVEFIYAGKRVRESAKTTRKTVAQNYEKNRRLELERAYAGLPTEDPTRRVLSVSDVVKPYLATYPLNHRPKSVVFATQRLGHVSRLLGTTLLPDLTEDRIKDYIATRLNDGVGGRTVNMELGELSRAMGKTWRELWPKVRKLEERQDVGRALSPAEERRLLDALSKVRHPLIGFFVRESLMTGMRSGELQSLTWAQVDFAERLITVGRAKTSSGTGRQIPINDELYAVLQAHASWFAKHKRFGEIRPEWYLFPYGKCWPQDPTQPTTTIKTAWKKLRDEAKVSCRLHDLRHTVATKMAEAGTPESTMLALLGHMSRAMLERYSHIRLKAKRAAMDALSTTDAKRKTAAAGAGDGVGTFVGTPVKKRSTTVNQNISQSIN